MRLRPSQPSRKRGKRKEGWREGESLREGGGHARRGGSRNNRPARILFKGSSRSSSRPKEREVRKTSEPRRERGMPRRPPRRDKGIPTFFAFSSNRSARRFFSRISTCFISSSRSPSFFIDLRDREGEGEGGRKRGREGGRVDGKVGVGGLI